MTLLWKFALVLLHLWSVLATLVSEVQCHRVADGSRCLLFHAKHTHNSRVPGLLRERGWEDIGAPQGADVVWVDGITVHRYVCLPGTSSSLL